MTAVAERREAYVSDFDAFRREAAFGPDWLGAIRETAFEHFRDAGFPTTRQEEWRFTNIAPVAERTFDRPGSDIAAPAAADLDTFSFSQIASEILVVNGRVASAPDLPNGVTVISLAQALQRGAGSDALPLGSLTHLRQPFAALNTAFFEDGVVIHVTPKAVLDRPIHVLFLSCAAGKPLMISPRLLVIAGESSQLQLIESYAGVGTETTFTNAVTEIVLDSNAVVDHVKVQRELPTAFHLANMFVKLGRASTFASRAITFGGRIARNDIVAELAGEGAECTLNGLYVTDRDALVDTHTTIDHAKPHCPSHEVYKGILGGKAKAVFNGKIIVRPDAQKTNAKQTNKALLLTDDAQINTKPQLEIFADDVKCTHGAAIGQLDEEAMFYLRARGLDEAAARSLLIHAFAGEILDGIRVDAVRERVQHVMEEKLAITSDVAS